MYNLTDDEQNSTALKNFGGCDGLFGLLYGELVEAAIRVHRKSQPRKAGKRVYDYSVFSDLLLTSQSCDCEKGPQYIDRATGSYMPDVVVKPVKQVSVD